MSVDDLVEAYLAGQEPTVPSELKEEFQRAIAGHKALGRALGETIVAPERPADGREMPALPEDYEVLRELGRGGMGVVYLARQRSLGRMVAVKVLRPGEIAFGPLVQRFVEEARHLARLRHPSIVSIHETGQAGDEPYFTMDYVEGESLHGMLKRGPLSPTQAVRILKQAAEGVEHAHAQGIIHRDLKPANILLDKAGRAYVTDFGLARDVTKGSELTGSGDILGTPAYMAPEQANGEKDRIGEATDVHALGVILYETLTGQAPYGGPNPVQVLVKLLQEEPVPPRTLNRRIPRDLETICLKAMEKAPEARYATVHALLEDLRHFENGEPVLARRTGVVTRLARWGLRHWRPLVSAAAATGLLLFLFHHYGPRVFDQSVSAMMSSAETHHGHGDHAAAVREYHAAWSASSDAREKDWCLQHMVRCAGELGETEAAADAWERVLSIAPDRSFGERDPAIARVLVAALKQRYFYLSEAAKREPARAELALTRLKVLFAGTQGTWEERGRLEGERDDLQAALHPSPQDSAPTYAGPRLLPPLPSNPAELLALADDERTDFFRRGRAACALGQTLEKAGIRAMALERYRQGYDWMRSSSPKYSCPGSTHPGEPPECLLLREAHAALRRLDPNEPDHLRGGIVFRLGGAELPEGDAAYVTPDLWRADLSEYDAIRGGQWSVTQAFGPDKTVRVGVADGRYGLGVIAQVNREREPAACEVDIEDIPRIVEVKGDWKEMPPLRVRKLDDVRLIAPTERAGVDLRQVVFRWGEVRGAKSYRVSISVFQEEVRWSSLKFAWADTTGTSLCLGDLPPGRIDGNASALVGGQSAEWWVDACDAAHKKIATSHPRRPILLEHGLGEK